MGTAVGAAAVPQQSSAGPWSNGPWKSVRSTPEPFNNSPDQLVAATNIYIPDTENGSGAYARWGYDTGNNAAAFASSGQVAFYHTDSAGVVYNFAISGGHMYRATANDLTIAWTDVTPTAYGIDSSSLVFALSSNGFLVINDESNTPWIASALSSTPITQTAIDFDGEGTVWRAVGQPVEYGGSVVFVLASVNSVACPTDIAWSAPGDPSLGYEQDPYDFRWTLLASGSGAINCLAATNLALYYFRDYSIGGLTGTPATAGSTSGSDFRNASTHDSISSDVGCNASRTIQQYGTNILFMDLAARPWLLPVGPWQQQVGAALVPLWEQMRSVLVAQSGIEPLQSGQPSLTRKYACAAIFPTLGLYVCGSYTVYGTGSPSFTYPISLAVFDAKTGAYEGQWYIGSGFTIQALGTVIGGTADTGAPIAMSMIIGGAGAPPDTDAYAWIAGDGVWQDLGQGTFPGAAPAASITTPRFGFDARLMTNVDKVTAITGSAVKVKITVATPLASANVTPTPLATLDGTYRAVGSVDIMGRGVSATVALDTTAVSAQWSVQQVIVEGVQSLAGPDDA